jgi:uncharacterized protein involved in propanediol utilization
MRNAASTVPALDGWTPAAGGEGSLASPAVSGRTVPPLAVEHIRCLTGTAVGAAKLGELYEDQSKPEGVGMPFPLPVRATATVRMGDGLVDVQPAPSDKANNILRAVLRRHRLDVGVSVHIERAVQPGKGGATSSGDMELAVRATLAALGLSVDSTSLRHSMAAIEPTDRLGAADGALQRWNFATARPLGRRHRLPHGTWVAGYPRAGCVATESIHGRRPTYTARERADLDLAAQALPSVLRARWLGGLAKIAGLSATINDEYFPRPELPRLRRLRDRGAALGFWCAHTGLALGAVGAPGRRDGLLADFAAAVGSGWDIWAFESTPALDRLPFLLGAGSTVVHLTT